VENEDPSKEEGLTLGADKGSRHAMKRYCVWSLFLIYPVLHLQARPRPRTASFYLLLFYLHQQPVVVR
jgi:hypothetical protein